MTCHTWKVFLMSYKCFREKQHTITVRNRETGFAKQYKYWNDKVIEKVLNQQKPSEDVYITKYPSDRLVEWIVLDFDSKEDISLAYKDAKRMKNYLTLNGHNCVLVSSGSKGYHLYFQIAPFLFKDTDIRNGVDWKRFFDAFVCFLIHDGKHTYETLDMRNTSAGLGGNIRLMGSKHPATGNLCAIIDGSFNLAEPQLVTRIQDEAQKKAYCHIEIKEQEKLDKLKKTKVVNGTDPIASNDLREVFRELTGDIKIYPKGYGYCSCPVHGTDSHFSLLVTKEWFSCSACDFKGNIWKLRKMGLVRFDDDGRVRL